MTSDFLSDSEIQNLISEPKDFKCEFKAFLSKSKEKQGHKENEFIIKRPDGSKFKIMIRQSKYNALDFSIILGFIKPNSNILIRLKRYNGKSHEHQNQIEKTPRFYNFHIHEITERYQLAGQYKPEHYAEPTNRYSDISTAWTCFANDCNIRYQDLHNQQIFID